MNRESWKTPLAIGGGQTAVGLILLAVGVFFDVTAFTPGLLTFAAFALLGGPGVALAIRERRRMSALEARERIVQLTGRSRVIHEIEDGGDE